MKTLRCILVDDKPAARRLLRKLLEARPGIAVVGEAQTLGEALELLAGEPPDVVFLETVLPAASGFDLLPHLAPATRVVFVTARAGPAVRAFEVNALDYLLKPVQPARLAQTLERLRDAAAPRDGVAGVVLGDHRKWDQVPPAALSAILADGNYSRAHTLEGREFFLRRSMLEWLDLLADAGFLMLSRSLIVNPAAVLRLEARGRDAALLHMTGMAAALTLGRSAALRARRCLAPGAEKSASPTDSSRIRADSSQTL